MVQLASDYTLRVWAGGGQIISVQRLLIAKMHRACRTSSASDPEEVKSLLRSCVNKAIKVNVPSPAIFVSSLVVRKVSIKS